MIWALLGPYCVTRDLAALPRVLQMERGITVNLMGIPGVLQVEGGLTSHPCRPTQDHQGGERINRALAGTLRVLQVV